MTAPPPTGIDPRTVDSPAMRAPPRTQRLADNQRSFAGVMGRAGSAGPSTPQTAPGRARDTAEQFVAHTLILPLLRQLRQTDQAAPPFAPTQAEKQFRALQDAELAQRIAHAERFPIVDRLARDLLKRGGKDALGRDAAGEIAGAPTPAPGPFSGAMTLASPPSHP